MDGLQTILYAGEMLDERRFKRINGELVEQPVQAEQSGGTQ